MCLGLLVIAPEALLLIYWLEYKMHIELGTDNIHRVCYSHLPNPIMIHIVGLSLEPSKLCDKLRKNLRE